MRNYRTTLVIVFAVLVMFVFLAAVAMADTIDADLHLGKGEYSYLFFKPTAVQITVYDINNKNAKIAIGTACRPTIPKFKKVVMKQVAATSIYSPKPPPYLKANLCGFAIYNAGKPTNLTINFSSPEELELVDTTWDRFVGWSTWVLRNYTRLH
jgi:hypothetical protein